MIALAASGDFLFQINAQKSSNLETKHPRFGVYTFSAALY
jgi:hypothetical protein